MLEPASSPPPPNFYERWADLKIRLRLNERVEKWWPLGAGIAAGALSLCCRFTADNYDALLSRVAPTAISVAAIFAGFQGTTHTILLSMRDSRVMRVLRSEGAFDTLVGYVGRGVMSLVLFVAVSMIALTVQATQPQPEGASGGASASWAGKLVIGLVVGLFVYALGASWRIVNLVMRMLRVSD